MSTIYITEPPTTGKVRERLTHSLSLLVLSFNRRWQVVMETTRGDYDIELWCKECPEACRNFLQLSLEGFYEGLIFHRLVKGLLALLVTETSDSFQPSWLDFVIQGGDPTGTGQGGESVTGKPYRVRGVTA